MHTSIIHRIAGGLLLSLLSFSPVHASKLRPEAVAGFQRYVQQAENRMKSETQAAGKFLWLNTLPSSGQNDAYRQLRKGEPTIYRVEDDKSMATPGAMIHHWIGTIFIPAASVQQVLAVVQDYNRHQEYYSPQVERSKLLQHAGNDFHFYYRLRFNKILTVVLDTEHQVHYTQVDAMHVLSNSYTTRIAEVKNAGEADETTLPPGKDTGFLWRLNSYWRFEESDGGVYVQCEAISLTRDVPKGLGLIIEPFIQNIPKESLDFTLRSTREVVLNKIAAGTLSKPGLHKSNQGTSQ